MASLFVTSIRFQKSSLKRIQGEYYKNMYWPHPM